MSEHERQNSNPILWNADTEVCLFYAMRGYKPVGINKHFHMMGIQSKFSQSLGQTVTSSQLWEHLSSMYNLTLLDESENLPFDNETRPFQLPDEILNYGKETPKIKEPEPERPAAVTKSSATKESSQQQSKSGTVTKSRKRTRNIATPSPGAVGPGANKRKRH